MVLQCCGGAQASVKIAMQLQFNPATAAKPRQWEHPELEALDLHTETH